MSVFYQLLTSVRDAITVPPGFNIALRKKAAHLQFDTNAIYVWPGAENVADEYASEDTEGYCFVNYPVNVTIVMPFAGSLLEQNLEQLLELKEQIRRTLYTVNLANVDASIVNVTINLQPSFEKAALDTANADVTSLMAVYKVHEPRSNL